MHPWHKEQRRRRQRWQRTQRPPLLKCRQPSSGGRQPKQLATLPSSTAGRQEAGRAAGRMAEYLQVAPNKLVLRFEIGKPAAASISLQVGHPPCVAAA